MLRSIASIIILVIFIFNSEVNASDSELWVDKTRKDLGCNDGASIHYGNLVYGNSYKFWLDTSYSDYYSYFVDKGRVGLKYFKRSYSERLDFNGDDSFPKPVWADELAKQNYIIEAGQTIRALEDDSSYTVKYRPLEIVESKDSADLVIAYEIEYYTQANDESEWLGPFKKISSCIIYTIILDEAGKHVPGQAKLNNTQSISDL